MIIIASLFALVALILTFQFIKKEDRENYVILIILYTLNITLIMAHI